MKYLALLLLAAFTPIINAQTFGGIVTDKVTSLPIEGATVTLVETNQTTTTTSSGIFTINVINSDEKTLQIHKEGYVFEDLRKVEPKSNFNIQLREKIKSAATMRWENYMASCAVYNNPNIPDDPEWNMKWTEQNLTGDLVRNSTYTRRDPTSVIAYNGAYYVWYTYKLSEPSTWFGNGPNLDGNTNVFPWDNADVYYATSTDGYHWNEQGPAITRGASGSFDDQSIFTPEIFTHNNKYYLVYQAVQWPYIERVKNTVGMAVADSPDGPWTKLDEPILRPTDNGVWRNGSNSRLDADTKGDFDSHKVHDPCLRFYNNKFYLYYKGESMGEERFCGEREIRWGVAIADHPTGPYVKSEYNPITTSGHEVAVWNYNGGIAIIQKLDGPERGTVQFAQDGINFEMKGSATDVPDALGVFRPETAGSSPRDGVSWGLAHRYEWGAVQGGSNYLVRFDLTETELLPSANALIIEAESFTDTGGTYDDSGSGGPGFGANKQGTKINFVNSNDWMDYSFTVPNTDNYNLYYDISTPASNAQVQFWVDGVKLAQTDVSPNGQWDNYNYVKHGSSVNLTSGLHTLRIVASGSDTWQWNLDKIALDAVSQLSIDNPKNTKKITLYPNPTNDDVYLTNLKEKSSYKIMSITGAVISEGVIAPNQSIKTSKLARGSYILIIQDSANFNSSLIFIKQ